MDFLFCLARFLFPSAHRFDQLRRLFVGRLGRFRSNENDCRVLLFLASVIAFGRDFSGDYADEEATSAVFFRYVPGFVIVRRLANYFRHAGRNDFHVKFEQLDPFFVRVQCVQAAFPFRRDEGRIFVFAFFFFVQVFCIFNGCCPPSQFRGLLANCLRLSAVGLSRRYYDEGFTVEVGGHCGPTDCRVGCPALRVHRILQVGSYEGGNVIVNCFQAVGGLFQLER